MCSTALLALLAPIQYTLTYIPLLPAQLIDYIEVFFFSFARSAGADALSHRNLLSDARQARVRRGFARVARPSRLRQSFSPFFPSFPALLPSFRGYPTPPHPAKRPAHLSETPPLSSRGFSPDSIDSVLWADRPDSKVATSCLFSLHLGPGPLGAYLQPERRQLVYVPVGTPAVIEDVVVLNSAKSRELKGWIGSYLDKCPLLQADPVILEINGTHGGTR